MNKRKPIDLAAVRNDPEFYFKVGQKYVRRRRLGTALRYINKAVDIEPYNADYQFNFACLLSEMKQLKKSNRILLGILKNIDPRLTECYFGMGCNYFNMADFKKAKECFEKYIYFDPEGQFVDEAYDVLSYLQFYEEPGIDSRKGGMVAKLVKEGKKLLDKGLYSRACKKLERAIEIYPELVSARNDLSVAYFHGGEYEKAISLAKSVLILEPKNVRALCNLALFYHHVNKTELCHKQLKTLERIKTIDRDELAILLQTYATLKKHAAIARLLLHYLKGRKEYEPLYMLSIAFYNLKQYHHAQEVLQAVRDLFPQYEPVTEHFARINADTQKGTMEHSEMNYFDKLPEIAENWYRDKLVASKAEKGDATGYPVKWRNEWNAIIDCAVDNREVVYRGNYRQELKNIWIMLAGILSGNGGLNTGKVEIWAAVLEYIYCKRHMVRITRKRLAEKYGVSPSSITAKLKLFGL